VLRQYSVRIHIGQLDCRAYEFGHSRCNFDDRQLYRLFQFSKDSCVVILGQHRVRILLGQLYRHVNLELVFLMIESCIVI